MNLKKLTTILAIITTSFTIQGQTEGVSIASTVAPPDPSAMLDIQSLNKGLLIPRVNLSGFTDIGTIPNPKKSLIVFNTPGSTAMPEGFYYWNATIWTKLGEGDALWKKIGSTNDIRYNQGKVQIGATTTAPLYDLEVNSPSSTNTFNFKGFQGELRFGTFDANAANGSGSFLTQTTRMVGSNDYSVEYNQVSSTGTRLLKIASGYGYSNISATGPIYIGGQDNVIFIPFNIGAGAPAAWFSQDGSFTHSSDSTLKMNITNLPSVLSKIITCRPVMFNWKANPQLSKNYGFLAQEIEQIFPELVSEASMPNSTTKIKGINYDGFISILLGGIKEQQAKIESLEQRILALENK